MATETWLLNEIPQWIGISSRDFSIQFTSNNQSFTLFRFNRSGVNQYDLQYNDVVVNGGPWNNSLNRPNWTGWTNEAYRTITFANAPTGDLLTWLQANGTKQQPTYKFKHWKKSNVVVNRTLVGEKYYYFKTYTILGLYTITTTLTNCTGASANATKIQENGDLTLTFTANSGYELPTGVSVTNVTSYNWNKATGVLAISNPTGDVAIEIVAVSALPQLTTPTNVAVTDTTLTFDEVANATSYEVFVDNVSIGEYVPRPSGYNLIIGGCYSYSGNIDTIAYIKFNGVATSTDYDCKAYTQYLTPYAKDKNGNAVSFPLELNNITNVNIYLEQGEIYLLSQKFNTIGNHNIVLSTNENTNISMVDSD